MTFGTIYQYMMENKQLNPNQSGLMPDDSCTSACFNYP